MARSTYHDQFHKLVDKGYLVPGTGNTFDFYEVPQSAAQARNMSSAGGRDFEECPSRDKVVNPDGQTVLPEDIEINNNSMTTNGVINNNDGTKEGDSNIYVPKVKEIVIPWPTVKGREQPQPKEPTKAEFYF